MAKTPRTWTGARSPSGLKRVRNSQRRNAVLQPRRSAAKTLVAKAVSAATQPTDSIDPAQALAEALSALDRAAKVGAIHPNAAARRKSRLTIKVNAALGGTGVSGGGKTKTTSKAAAQKAARARIAAAKADKAKGAQTAAGKARAALSRTARDTAAAAAAAKQETAAPKATTATKSSGAKTAAPKAKTATKAKASTSTAKSTASKTATKTTASKATAAKTKAAPKAKKA